MVFQSIFIKKKYFIWNGSYHERDSMTSDEQASNKQLYKMTLEKVWEDGILTEEETVLLQGLRKALNISVEEHAEMEKEVKSGVKQVNNETYRLVLEQAWNDGIVTNDESDMLAKLRKGLKINDEIHALIEAQVKKNLPDMNVDASLVKEDLKDDSAEYWIAKGESVWRKSKQTEEAAKKAMDYFDKAIDISPLNYLAWSNKGLILKKMNRKEDAIACYDKAIEINPRFPNAWFNKGVLLGTIGKIDEAIECLDEVLKIKPDNQLARRDRDILLQIQKKKKE